MLFLRVETHKGIGPFAGGIADEIDHKLGYRIYFHPGPAESCEMSSPLGRWYNQHYPFVSKFKYGFISLDQCLDCWINKIIVTTKNRKKTIKAAMALLHRRGYELSVYQVPLRAVIRGNYQAVIKENHLENGYQARIPMPELLRDRDELIQLIDEKLLDRTF